MPITVTLLPLRSERAWIRRPPVPAPSRAVVDELCRNAGASGSAAAILINPMVLSHDPQSAAPHQEHGAFRFKVRKRTCSPRRMAPSHVRPHGAIAALVVRPPVARRCAAANRTSAQVHHLSAGATGRSPGVLPRGPIGPCTLSLRDRAPRRWSGPCAGRLRAVYDPSIAASSGSSRGRSPS